MLVQTICAAADSAAEAWPARPEPPAPQVNLPSAPGDVVLPAPKSPEAVFAEPLPPTQAVPPGVRPLIGSAVSVTSHDGMFEVNAPDYESAYRVLDICTNMKTISARFFTWPEKFSTPIRIKIVPATTADFSTPFLIQASGNGPPTAQVRWDANLSFFDMCQAVSRVSLQNIVFTKDGAAAGQVPDWLALGLAAYLESNIKPAMLDELSDQARRFPMLSMRQIMTARSPSGPDVRLLAVNAFWLITFLNDQCANSNVAHALFDALAVGIDPAPLLGTAFPGKFNDPRDLELWWQVGYRDELNAHPAPFQSMSETRALLDQLERVQLMRNNIPQRVRLDEAWDARTDKALRDALEKILITMREVPNRANPVYKNALVSLLISLQQLHGDDKSAFDYAWKQYLADRAAGEATENTVNAALSDAQSN